MKFKITQGGAQIGINDVVRRARHDRQRLARPALDRPAGLVFYPIAKYGICVITNKSNPLPNLTPRRSSRSSPARRAAGAPSPAQRATGTIDLISRTSVAGVLTNFQTLLLEGKKVSTLAAEQPLRV